MKRIRRLPRRKEHFAAGYHLLAVAEALLAEAPSDPRDYGPGWYLKTLMQIERLLNSLRPMNPSVGKKNFDKYYKRETNIRDQIWQFAATLDPALSKTIMSSMKDIDQRISDIPNGIPSDDQTHIDAYMKALGRN